jgi:hypothetical protein
MCVMTSALDQAVREIGLRGSEHAKGFPNRFGSFDAQLLSSKKALNHLCNLVTIGGIQAGENPHDFD